MSLQLRDGSIVTDPRLDRLVHFDSRSRAYPLIDMIEAPLRTPVTTAWSLPAGSPVLDQGQNGSCVGFGVTNELRFTPVAVPGLDATFAHDTIYWGAQRIDPWPGGSYPGASPVYEGTSVLCGVKTARNLGYYGGLRWAFSEAELAIAVSRSGPVVLGVVWTLDMFTPDAHGFIHPTGAEAGGHCILCCAINVEQGYYTLYNSWGPRWGLGGTCRVTRADMTAILHNQGEACIPTGRTQPTPAA